MEAPSNSYVTEASLVHDLLLFDWGHSLITSEQLAHNTYVKYMQYPCEIHARNIYKQSLEFKWNIALILPFHGHLHQA